MHLEKLQLNGFKSFANLTVLTFTKGITAIVGPNGSGKSNVSDAVRWALGEQSMKSIRGKKSEDVIFAGSDKKSRLGMGEVSLYLNNEDGQAPIDYSELVLTRRFYRSREGEYLLNNSKVRLADIQMLLAKANVGQKTYSVIGQGQIDHVLLSSSKERKDFFDEATGVKQYQLKRDEALNKLLRTHENLAQGNMVLHEIEPRLRSLTRQVRRFEQKEKIEQELNSLQQYHYYRIWSAYQSDQQELGSHREKLQAKLVAAQTAQTALRNEMEQMGGGASREHTFAELQEQYEEIQKEKHQYVREQAVLEGQSDVTLKQSGGGELVFLKRRHQEVEEQIRSKEAECEKLTVQLNEREAVFGSQKQKQQSVLDEFENLEKQLESLQAQGQNKISLKEVEAHLSRLLSQIDELIATFEQVDQLEDLTHPRRQLAQAHDNISMLLKQVGSQKQQEDSQEIRSVEQQIKELLVTKDTMVKELADTGSMIAVLRARLDDAAAEITSLQLVLREVESAINKQSGRTSKSEQQVELVKKIQEVDERLAKINTSIREFNQVEQAKKEALLEKQHQLQQQQVMVDSLKQELNGIEVEEVRLETKLEDLALEVNREAGIFLANLIDDWRKQPPTLPEGYEADNVSGSIEGLKKKKEMIGGIEPEVIGEYQEVKEKYDFLTTQTADLTASLDNLISIIRELDDIITEQFTNNFKQINELFNKYFRMLFSGGKAELTLLKYMDKTETDNTTNEDSEEIAEEELIDEGQEDEFQQVMKEATRQSIVGIEIKATPPGKKMKGIGMLSGGERALASIALICAMIANNPSPFVVLDEVDAALDEANSIRFAEIISELSDKTQFVVITHNRATMEKADILYGVTMGGDGVSNVLSIQFEQAQEYANRY